MVETWWGGLLLPPVLVAFAVAGAAFDSVLTARAAGAPARPLRSVVGLLAQRRRRTAAADALLWRGGAIALVVAAVLASAATPLGHHVVGDLSVGVVWFNAMEVVAWAAVWLVGWGSNSAFPLVSGYRFVAQGLAYELPHMFALITAALGAGSLRVGDVVAAQRDVWFVVWMPVAFLVYLVSVPAMAFFRPFDQAAGADAGGGVLAELSGVDRLVFIAGRWLLLVSGAAMAVPLFLGGGSGPLLPGWAWSVVKTAAVLALLVWAGRRFPTIRVDRFQEVAWLVLLPATLVQALFVSLVVVAR
ncbi:NADH-quinone oxidoreductase subunit H [Saccharothrix obliqua]|uniref:NADH-quinone oxidoreductase subunit H n=1 Tax=Saccharothrix obliqua TaxID=2861747 RepID=UPI001C607D63|nr:NADH-quinone oxidoreductase subunit H [Saccharothrix obliqua]MBW4718663.1 NADH-quinone oxidoreductase subunit H [Saccharothrix obliqua]